MAIFDNKKIIFLEEERQKLWERLTALEQSFNELRDSDSNASHTLGCLQKASRCANSAERKLAEIDKTSEEFKEVEELVEDFNAAYDKVDTATKLAREIKAWHEDANSDIQTIQTVLTDVSKIKTDLLEKQTTSTDLSTKISSFHSKANNLISEIEELRNEVLGYDYEDEETGEEKHVVGLQEKLTKSFKNLEEQIKNSDKNLQAFFNDGNSQVDAFLENIENRYNEVDCKIKSLLPDALTAGLASAYEKKRTAEEDKQ